jgi:predicted alpha/beta superfamily hydrolase
MNRQSEKRSRTCRVKANGIIPSCIPVMLLICLCSLKAQTQNPVVNAAPEVTIAGTQLLPLKSTITGKDYNLYINLPAGYGDTSKTFPVVYLIDAQWDFPLVQAIYGEQYYDGFIPELVIVGITWGGSHPNYDQLRAHDFTPTDMSKNGTYGNAPKFLSFISGELIPYIEANFRVKKNDRTLIGSSFGGLFSIYALFHEPAVFNRFVFTSPAIQWDNEITRSMNNSFAEQHKYLNAKVFAGIGAYENVKEFQIFMDEIKAKQYKNFELQTWVVSGMGHSGAKAEAYARGLQAVFAQPNVEVDPKILASYTGEYAINPMASVKLVVEDGKLVAIAPDNTKIALNAASEEEFYVIGQFLRLHFVKSNGKVDGFILQQFGGSMVVKRKDK